jgi:hypothetical protein
MKQTALNWLILNISYTTSQGEVISYQKDITRFVELAKQMEKQQIEKVFVDVTRATLQNIGIKSTLQDIIDFQKIAEVYYNEEFKPK